MFFAPLALGATILVFSCLALLVCVKLPPLGIGVTLGVLTLSLKHSLLLINNLFFLASIFIVVPTIIFGKIAVKKANATCKNDKIKIFIENALFFLPVMCILTIILFENWLEPVSNIHNIVDSNNSMQMYEQLDDFKDRNESYIQAMIMLNKVSTYASISWVYFGIRWVYRKIKQGYDEEMNHTR